MKEKKKEQTTGEVYLLKWSLSRTVLLVPIYL